MERNIVAKKEEVGAYLQKITDFKPDNNYSVDTYKLLKRTEKISAALSLVSNFFPIDDPLTIRIKECATDILRPMSFILSGDEVGSSYKQLYRTFIEIVSLLETAHAVGFISTQNFVVIIEQIEVSAIEVSVVIFKQSSGHVAIESAFFEDFSKRNVSFEDSYKPDAIKDKIHKRQINIKDKSNSVLLPQGGVVQTKKNSRRESIISLLKKEDNVSIKDISSRMKDCSEKTIQRELIEMIEEGVIKKEGERRWSLYSLVR